ncbi:MAG: hypothetical protein ABIN89_10760 [Chitinophagaceae bacterium]
MKKYLLCAVMMLVIYLPAVLAQREEPEPTEKKGFDKSKLFIGGNLGASFGDYSLANISPQLGYRFNDYLAAGVGINFLYSSIKYRYSDGSLDSKTSYGVTGLNVFGRVYPIKYILLQAQPELNYVWVKEKYYDGTPDYKIPGKLVPSLLLGGGAVIPQGPGALVIMVQFDVLNQAQNPYGNRPIYNFGYNIGF